MAKKFFNRLSTKVGGALGNIQRSELDQKTRDSIQRFEVTKERTEKILSDVKATTPAVSGLTSNEKFAQVLITTASLYGNTEECSKMILNIGNALNQIGKAERQMCQTLLNSCYPNLSTFVNTIYPSFKQEKDRLVNKMLDVDGAKDKNLKHPSAEAQTAETVATNEYTIQLKKVEGLFERIPTSQTCHAASMKAYVQALIDFHKKCAELLLNSIA